MFKKIALIAVIVATQAGCMTNAIKALSTMNIEKTIGTKNPQFVLEHQTFSVITGTYDSDRTRYIYSKDICDGYNEDEQLKRLHKVGIISHLPTCVQQDPEQKLIVEVGTTKEKCFIACTDIYIKHVDSKGEVLAYSEVRNLGLLEAIEYSSDHIKNMVILAHVKKNEGNEAWIKNLERVCKEDKSLRSVCR